MELKGIKEFLEQYKKILLKADDERDVIKESIYVISGVVVLNKDFKINHSIIELKVNSVKKNHIFLYKDAIINDLKNKHIKPIIDIH